MIELCIEVDKNNRSIGLRPITDFKTAKFIHRSVHLLLFNSKGEVLIQKRSANKIWYPNLYTYSVSGVVENENYKNCIKREMKEEIGINTPVNLLFIYPYFDKLDKSFHALFKGKTNKKIIQKPQNSLQLALAYSWFGNYPKYWYNINQFKYKF